MIGCVLKDGGRGREMGMGKEMEMGGGWDAVGMGGGKVVVGSG